MTETRDLIVAAAELLQKLNALASQSTDDQSELVRIHVETGLIREEWQRLMIELKSRHGQAELPLPLQPGAGGRNSMRELHLHTLDKQGESIAITQFPCVIGRQPDCDRCLDFPFISRRHCSLYVRNDQVWVQDLASYNGTAVNGESAACPRVVQDGDVLSLGGQLAFRVRLPAQFGAAIVQSGAEVQACERPAPPHRVLVVDDNEDAADTLAMLLRGWGHEVRVAYDGPAAVEAADDAQPDTVLLDLQLPGMDGYQVAQVLRQRPDLKNALLVAMTGYDTEDCRPAGEAGFDRFLVKPVDAEVLQEVLSR